MSQKGFAPIFLLIGVLIAAAGGIYYLKTVNNKPQSIPSPTPLPIITSQTSPTYSPKPIPSPSPRIICETDQTCGAGFKCQIESCPQPQVYCSPNSDPNCGKTTCKGYCFKETDNWRVHNNKDYNFSFKYPPSFIFKKESTSKFDSTDFDGEKVLVTQTWFEFTASKPNTDQDLCSSFDVNIIAAHGKTLTKTYNNKKGFGGEMTKVTLLEKTANADEVAKVSGIQNSIRIYKKGDYFFEFGVPPNSCVDRDSPDNILTYIDEILGTLEFKDNYP